MIIEIMFVIFYFIFNDLTFKFIFNDYQNIYFFFSINFHIDIRNGNSAV